LFKQFFFVLGFSEGGGGQVDINVFDFEEKSTVLEI
jgi:hypothetical protein